jgi:hypothetical protein
MNNTPSHNNGHETLFVGSFLPSFGWEGGFSALEAKLLRGLSQSLRRILPSCQHERLRIFVHSILSRRVVNRYSLDVYGQPRILTGWKAILYSLAWPTVIGVSIGFGLAISLAVIHTTPFATSQQKHRSQQIAALEIVP